MACGVLVAISALVSGCGSSDPASDASVPTDTGSDVPTTTDTGSDVPTTTDAGSDVPTVTDTGNDVPTTTDAGSGGENAVEDGTYSVVAWTCMGGGATRDVRARATAIGLADVRLVISGTTGRSEGVFAGSPACTRTIPQTISYPSRGSITTTSGTVFMCSSTCAPAACTSGSQPVIVDTFAFERVGSSPTTYTFRRTNNAVVGLQLAAGCQNGDLEEIRYQRQ